MTIYNFNYIYLSSSYSYLWIVCENQYYFYFCDKWTLMSQQQHQQNQNAQTQPLSTDLKVNPETFNTQQHTISNKQNQLYASESQEIETLLKTPLRNKSQQRAQVSGEKYSQSKHSQSLTHSTKTPARQRFKASQRIQEQEQEADHKNYDQLTHKLEFVLNKIASSKPVPKITQGQNLIVRFEECQDRKKKLIDKKKEEYKQLQAKELKQKPTIDRNSDKISKEIGHKPIYLRVDALVEQKRKKLERNEEIKRQKQEEQEQSFLEQYQKHTKKPQNCRSYQQYFSQMVRWKEKRERENKQKLQLKKSKQLEGITFQPILNSKSKKMVNSHKRLPIEQRGLPNPKKNQENTYKKSTFNI